MTRAAKRYGQIRIFPLRCAKEGDLPHRR